MLKIVLKISNKNVEDNGVLELPIMKVYHNNKLKVFIKKKMLMARYYD